MEFSLIGVIEDIGLDGNHPHQRGQQVGEGEGKKEDIEPPKPHIGEVESNEWQNENSEDHEGYKVEDL
jgi:hypothetical protein